MMMMMMLPGPTTPASHNLKQTNETSNTDMSKSIVKATVLAQFVRVRV